MGIMMYKITMVRVILQMIRKKIWKFFLYFFFFKAKDTEQENDSRGKGKIKTLIRNDLTQLTEKEGGSESISTEEGLFNYTERLLCLC